jgi:hypothetical protein
LSKSHLKCHNTEYVRAGDEVYCFVELIDEFDNPKGSSLASSTIEMLVERDGVEENRFTNAIYMDVGVYMLTVSSNIAGSVSVKAKYKGSIIDENAVHTLNILPGPASKATSVISCPSTVLGSVQAVCNLKMKDRFNNPTNFEISKILQTSIIGPNGVVPSTLVEGNVFGNYRILYDTFMVGKFNVTIGKNVFGTSALSSKTVESKSQVKCMEKVEFGGGLACSIFTYDVHGNATENAYDKSGFVVKIVVGGTTYQDIPVEYMSQNRFLAQIPAQRSGTGTYYFRFKEMLQSHHRLLLGSRRRLHGALGSYQPVQVNCGAPSVTTTFRWCAKSVNAGDVLRCWILPRDSGHGRSCIANDVSFELAGTPAIQEAQNSSNTLEYLTRSFIRTTSGDSTIQVNYRNNGINYAVGQGIVVAISPGAITTIETTCPKDIILSSNIVCKVITKDKYGNAAGTLSSEIERNFQIASTTKINSNIVNTAVGHFDLKYYVSPSSFQNGEEIVIHSISGSKNWTVTTRETNLNTIVITCPSSAVAGATITCDVMTRDNLGTLYGNESESFGFSVSLVSVSSNDVMVQSRNEPIVRFIEEGIYQVISSITTSGSYRLNILFKNKNMTSSSGDFNIEYSSFSNVNSVSSCPTKAMYLENVACTVTLRDIYGNLYGNNMSAAISHRLEIIGSSVLNGIVEYLSPGQYTVRYKPPTTGLAAISTKFNQNTFVSDQTSYINIEAGYGSKTSMGCPSVVVLNSTFLCKLNVSDLNDNPTNAGTISSSNFTFGNSNNNIKFMKVAQTSTIGQYDVVLQAMITSVSSAVSVANGNTENIEIVSSNLVTSLFDIQCFNSTVYAGRSFSYEIIGKNSSNSVLVDELHSRAFSINIHQKATSTGVVTNTITEYEKGTLAVSGANYQIVVGLNTAGDYYITLMFANNVLFLDRKIEVLPEQEVHQVLLDCPNIVRNNDTFSCIVSTVDRYGNIFGNTENLNAFSFFAYDETTGKPYTLETTIVNSSTGGKYSVSPKDSSYIGSKIIINSVFIATSGVKKNDSFINVNFTAVTPSVEAVSSTVPTSTTTTSPVASSSNMTNATKNITEILSTTTTAATSSSTCFSKDYLYNLCVQQRGKWAFTCKTASWKIGNICISNTTGFVNVTNSTGEIICKPVCE